MFFSIYGGDQYKKKNKRIQTSKTDKRPPEVLRAENGDMMTRHSFDSMMHGCCTSQILMLHN